MTQSSDTNNAIKQLANNDVETTYPNVYRSDEDLKNHAFAVAQQEVENGPLQTTVSVQDYADKYIAAYREAVEKHDADQ